MSVFLSLAKSLIPPQARPKMKANLRRLRSFGTARFCLLCDSHIRAFLPDGQPPRPESLCPVCKSKGRHRIFWHYLATQSELLRAQPVLFLHFAPEPAIARRLARLEHVQYLRVDCRPEAVDARVDIHRLPLADASFDFIYASHVLNCVRDDQQALRELHRVLKPRGRLIAQMSVYNAPATIEYEHSNPGDGCFREYGFDVVTRLEEAGFDVTVEQVIDRMPADEVRRLGMDDTDGSRRQNDLYICRKISA